MLGRLLIVAYVASAIYCYWQLDDMINRCLDLFRERHPSLPIEDAGFWSGLSLGFKILGVCAIPVLNLVLGYICATLDDGTVSEIVGNVEAAHWKEIRLQEESAREREELNKYF